MYRHCNNNARRTEPSCFKRHFSFTESRSQIPNRQRYGARVVPEVSRNMGQQHPPSGVLETAAGASDSHNGEKPVVWERPGQKLMWWSRGLASLTFNYGEFAIIETGVMHALPYP
jgi:hypothetical protein